MHIINANVTAPGEVAPATQDATTATGTASRIVSAPGTGTAPAMTSSILKSQLREQMNNQPAQRAEAMLTAAQPLPAIRTLLNQAADKLGFNEITSENKAKVIAHIKKTKELAARLSSLVAKATEYEVCHRELNALDQEVEQAAHAQAQGLSGDALQAAKSRLLAEDDRFQARFNELKANIMPWHTTINALDAQFPQTKPGQPTYADNVNGWVGNIKALMEVNRQHFEKELYAITIADIQPGDPYFRKESPPESLAHSDTLPRQAKTELNGVPNNRGDINVFHAGLAINDAFLDMFDRAAHLSGVDPDSDKVRPLLGEMLDLVLGKQKRPGRLTEAMKEFDQLVDAIKTVASGGESPIPDKFNKAELIEATSQIGEMRGGLGTTNAMRALVQSLQGGSYWFYRAKDGSGPVSAAMARAFASTSDDGSKKPLAYSTSILGGSMITSSALLDQTPDGEWDARQVAGNPLLMPQEIDPFREFNKILKADPALSEMYKALPKDIKADVTLYPPELKAAVEQAKASANEKFRENAHYETTRGKMRVGGETCSTFLVRTGQAGKMQKAVQKEIEDFTAKLRIRSPGLTGKQLGEAVTKEFGPFDGEEVSERIAQIFKEEQSRFTGMLAVKPEGMSPKTGEHFCRDEDLYDFIGVLTISDADVLAKEPRFDKSGKEIKPEPSPIPYLGTGIANHPPESSQAEASTSAR